MEREYRKEGLKRYVKAKIHNHLTYQPAGPPDHSSAFWAWTSHTDWGNCVNAIGSKKTELNKNMLEVE
jgi:hypothetical protein